MGNTNRLQLRDSVNTWLQTEEVEEDALDALLVLPDNLADVFDCIGPAEAAALAEHRTSHLRKLVLHAIEVLKRFVRSEHQLDHKYVLNCVRFATRLAPVLFTCRGESHIQDLLWGEAQAALELVDSLMSLCFSSKFTIPVRDSDISLSELLWYRGLVKETVGASSLAYEEARTEVLRCILAYCSETIYELQSNLKSYRNPWVWLWTSKDLRHTKALFFSLLNGVLGYQPEGWFGYGESATRELAQLSAHLLIVLLDTEIPTLEQIQHSETLKQTQKCIQKLHSVSEGPLSGATHLPLLQIYSHLAKDLSDSLDFEFIAKNLLKLLKSARSDGFLVEESLLLLWEFIDLNSRFEAFVCSEDYAGELFKCILYFLWSHYKDSQKVGILQICSFILLHLSGVRSFCVALGEEYKKDLGLDVPNGVETLADLLIVFTYNFITANSDLLSLISCLVTILRNVSPYVKTIGTLASIHITALVKLFSSQKLIESDSLYLQLVSALLELLDNRIQYQWDGSIHVLYALLMRKEVFERLFSLDIAAPATDEMSLQSVLRSHAADTLKALFAYLDPEVQELEKRFEQVTENEVLDLLREVTAVGVIPPPHHILVHRYRGNTETRSWLQTFVWAVVYVNQPSFQLSGNSGVRLFELKVKA